MLRFILKRFSIIFFLTWNAQPIIDCLKGSNSNFGSMFPQGTNFFKVKSNHTFHCSLRNNVFTLNNRTVRANCSDLRVSANGKNIDTRCKNSLTAEFNVSNATADDSGHYICKVHKTLICVSKYQFGYEPEPVNNFTCISEAFQKLRCSWTRNYNPIPTNYSLIYMPNYLDYKFNALDCPQNTSKHQVKDWCEWTRNIPDIYYRNIDTLFFRQIGVNAFGIWVKSYTLNHHELIRAGKPTNLKFTEIGKNYAKITWAHPIDMGLMVSPPVLYELEYKACIYEDNFKTKEVGINVFETRIELIPNLKYIIRLHCRVINSTKWSHYISTSLKTLPDVPYSSPKIINQSFDVENGENRGNRTITLYWQGIYKKHCNGDGCQYIIYISLINDERRKRADYEQKVNTTDTFFTFPDLLLNEDYQFVIKTKNNQGESTASARIVVPKMNKIPNLTIEVATSSDDDGYNVTWKPRSSYKNDEIVKYTVAKCRVLQPMQRDAGCSGEIEWFDVPADTKSYFFKIRDKHSYTFAVAATNKFGMPSGLQWIPCVVPHNKVLGKIENVSVDNKSSSELKITAKLNCTALYAVVKYFNISYSRCFQKCFNTTNQCVDRKYKRLDKGAKLLVDKLEPFTSYSLQIATVVEDGTSEFSDPVCATTSPAEPTDPPRDFLITNVTAHSATVLWKSPKTPNGIITKYTISGGPKEIYFVPKNVCEKNETFNVTLANLTAYHGYSIAIQACVNGSLCKTTDEIRFRTAISEPGYMENPKVSFNNKTSVYVEWKPPQHPNGPIDAYVLYWCQEHACQNDSSANERNVSGDIASLPLDIDCGSSENDRTAIEYLFTIRAVNELNGTLLYGSLSSPTKKTLCDFDSQASSIFFTIGLTIGTVLVLLALSLILYPLVRKVIDIVGKIINVGEIDLPVGLSNSSNCDTTSSYEERTVNGLQRCLSFFVSYYYNYRIRHDSGTSTSTTESVTKQNITNEKTGRNPSGDSSGYGSTGGNDSSTSSLNHRPDSDNEAVAKNSPLPKVELHGEETDAKPERWLNIFSVSGSKYSCVNKGDSDEKSKSPANSNREDSINKTLLYGKKLANSEPSTSEMDEVNPYSQVHTEPILDGAILESAVAAQHSKFELSHNVQDILGLKNSDLDRNEVLMGNCSKIEEAMLPYSIFGTRPVKSPSNLNNPYIKVEMAKEFLRPKENYISDVAFLRKNQIASSVKGYLPDERFQNSEPIDKDNMINYKIRLAEANYVGNENFNLAMKQLEAPSTSKPQEDYVCLDDLKIFPLSQLLANSKNINDIELPELEDRDLGKVDVGGSMVPYSCIGPSPSKDSREKNPAPVSILNETIAPLPPSANSYVSKDALLQISERNLDNTFLDETMTPADLLSSANGYVSKDASLRSSEGNLDKTSFNSPSLSNELLAKIEVKENRLPDVNVKPSHEYLSVSQLPSI